MEQAARIAANIKRSIRQNRKPASKPEDPRSIDEILDSMLKKAEAIGTTDEAPPPPTPKLPPNPGPFRTSGLHQSVKTACQAAEKWMKDIEAHAAPYWLTLYGSSGCGKSHLQQLAHYLLRKSGTKALRKKWPLVVDELAQDDSLLYRLQSVPVLLLDDIGSDYIGSEKKAQFVASQLYKICEERLGRWTFLTSNLSPKDIAERIDVRIASRLYRGGSVLVDMSSAQDYSLVKREKTIRNPRA